MLGRDRVSGSIKAKNEAIHLIDWDLVIFDEYHFGAWRENAAALFADDEQVIERSEALLDTSDAAQKKLAEITADLQEALPPEAEFLPIRARAFLYLSGTPFRALFAGEFIEEQVFSWTYTDEQRAKAEWDAAHPGERNPYAALPMVSLFTYQMPDELTAIANMGEFDEFDLNEFFAASGTGLLAQFKHKDDVQKWLNIIRGSYNPQTVDQLKSGTKAPFPYENARLCQLRQSDSGGDIFFRYPPLTASFSRSVRH